MRELAQLRACYAHYIEYTRSLTQKSAVTDGLFGLGNDPRKDAGHERFYDAAERIADAIAKAEPTPEEACVAVEQILQAEQTYREEELAVWFLIAAQGHALKLIDFLSPEDAARLRGWYEKTYPRHMRLPIQNQVLKALKRRK